MAHCSGNARKAIKLLKRQGIETPPARSTLQRWIEEYREQYSRLREEVLPQLYDRHSDSLHQLIEREMDAEGELLTLLMEKKDDLSGHELSTSLRNVSTAKAINFDKARLADDRPTSIVQTGDIGDVIQTLLQEGMDQELISALVGSGDWVEAIEGEAEEIEG